MPFQLIYSGHFDRDKGLDYGRLLLNFVSENPRESHDIRVWRATSSHVNLQKAEDFHQKGGLIPPSYRCPDLKRWWVETNPVYLPKKGIMGNFYIIKPFEVKTDRGTIRGDFGIHYDDGMNGSLGCIVMDKPNFKEFEEDMKKLRDSGIKEVELIVIYS